MPLQTYDQYFGQPQSPAEGFRKGLLTGEGIQNRQFRNALLKDQNERAKAQEGRALETHERGKVEDSQADQALAMEGLKAKARAIRIDTVENFLEDMKTSAKALDEGVVAALGNTEDAQKVRATLRAMQNKIYPHGAEVGSTQANMEAAENARKYFALLQRQFGVEKKQTPEEKAKQELETYEGKKKIDQKYPDPDKPGEAEERKIRLEKAKVDLQNAKTAYQKSLKGDKLTDDDVIYFGERLATLQKKRDDAGPPSTFMGIEYGGGEELTKGEKQEMVVLDRLLHQEYPASKLGTQAPAPPPPEQGMGQPPPQEGIALPPEILNGLVQGTPKGVKFPDGTVHKLMLDENGQPVEVQ